MVCRATKGLEFGATDEEEMIEKEEQGLLFLLFGEIVDPAIKSFFKTFELAWLVIIECDAPEVLDSAVVEEVLIVRGGVGL